MNDETQNELLSAYLDGEVTEAERAQVEKLLASDPAAQKLLDELRALSTTLKSLPRRKLGDNLSENVLRAAKQRMLTESADSAKTPTSTSEEPVPAFSKRILRRLKNPRMWIWEAVIVAAAVLLLIYNPNWNLDQIVPPAGNAERTIAMAPKEEKSTAIGPSGIRAAKTDAFADWNVPEDLKKAPEGAINMPGLAGVAQADRQPVPDTQPSAATPEMQSTAPAGDGKIATPPARRAYAKDTDDPGGLGSEVKTAERESYQLYAKPSPDTQVLSRKAASALGDKVVAKDRLGAAQLAETDADDKTANFSKFNTASADEMLEVHIEVTPDGQKNRAFDKLLAENGIVWTDTQKETLPQAIPPKQEMPRSLMASKLDQVEAKSEELDLSKSAQTDFDSKKAEPVELVLVEASPAQIEATLNGLSSQTNWFFTTSIAQTDGSQVKQFIAGDTIRGEIIQNGLPSQTNATQSSDKAKRIYRASPVSPSLASTGVGQGRAQRVPAYSGYKIQSGALETDYQKQTVGGVAQKTPLPQATAAGERSSPQGDEFKSGIQSYGSAAASSSSARGTINQLQQQARTLNEQETAKIPSQSSTLEKTSPAKAPAMQRVLFVLRLTDQKNSSDKSKASQSKASTTPAQSAPSATPTPTDAVPDK